MKKLSYVTYVNLLRGETGYHEGRNADGSWNNHQKYSPAVSGLEWSQDQPWCHTFGSWGADELGHREALPITASCAAGVQWFTKRNRWSEYPSLGALFYMGSRGQDHVGVVYAYDPLKIFTVEGNTNAGGSYQGDGVYLRIRPRRGFGSPYGYGRPDFEEPLISADGGPVKASVPLSPGIAKPKISLAHLIRAAHRDPGLPQGGTTYPKEVNLVEAALTREGLLLNAYSRDGSYGTLTQAAMSSWQEKCGYTGRHPGQGADGIPGRVTLTKLGAKHGFVVID